MISALCKMACEGVAVGREMAELLRNTMHRHNQPIRSSQGTQEAKGQRLVREMAAAAAQHEALPPPTHLKIPRGSGGGNNSLPNLKTHSLIEASSIDELLLRQVYVQEVCRLRTLP